MEEEEATLLFLLPHSSLHRPRRADWRWPRCRHVCKVQVTGLIPAVWILKEEVWILLDWVSISQLTWLRVTLTSRISCWAPISRWLSRVLTQWRQWLWWNEHWSKSCRSCRPGISQKVWVFMSKNQTFCSRVKWYWSEFDVLIFWWFWFFYPGWNWSSFHRACWSPALPPRNRSLTLWPH